MLAILFASLLVVAPAEKDALLQAVPVDAVALLSIQDIEGLEATIKESAWARFAQDPAMEGLVDYVMKNFNVDLEEKEAVKDLLPDKLFSAISDVVMCMCVNEETKKGWAAVIVKPRETRDAFDEYLGHLKDFLYESEEFSDRTETHDDMELLILEPTEDSGGEVVLALADGGGPVLFFVTSAEEGNLEKVYPLLDSLGGEGDKDSILDAERFQAARDRVAGEGQIECYLDLKAIIDLVNKFGEENEGIPPFLGLEAFTCFYKKVLLGEGERVKASAFVGLEGEGLLRDLLDCFQGTPALEMLQSMPEDTIAAVAAFMDLYGIYTRCMEEFKTQAPEEYDAFRNGYDQMVKQRFGIDPEAEILALLDGRLGSFTVKVPKEEFAVMDAFGTGIAEQAGADSAGFTYLIGVKDGAAFQANFEKILRAFGVYVSMKKEEFQGQRIYSVQLPMAGMRIFWTFTPDVFAVSLFPTAIRSFVRLSLHEDQPSIADREEYEEILGRYKKSSMITISRTSDWVRGVIGGFAGGFVGAIRAAGKDPGTAMQEAMKEAMTLVPEKDVVEGYFEGVLTMVMDVDETGALIRFVNE